MTNNNNTLELKILPRVVLCPTRPNDVTPAKLDPDLGSQGHLWSEKCHYVLVEAEICLRLLHTSNLDMYKMFQPLVCCLKGMWVHPYTVTPAKLSPDLGIQVHLQSEKYVITSFLRLISASDRFIHPQYTHIHKKCLSYLYAVSREYGCTLVPLHRPSVRRDPKVLRRVSWILNKGFAFCKPILYF
jgi:hypothetical protein